ncbi:hypothetical protein KEM48_008006 [Puccinia striiformis f. sp. tritici PST-130]|nr:hypothetical protein KEM48_008006 [Puccinia striiformis f. sp. tritici PST-130]
MRKKAPVVEPTLGSGSRCEVNTFFDEKFNEKSRFEPRAQHPSLPYAERPAIFFEPRPSFSSSTPLHIMDLLPVFHGKIQSPITHTTSELLLVYSQVSAKTLLPAVSCLRCSQLIGLRHASIGIVLYSDVLDVEYHNRSLHSQSPICGEWFSDRDAVIRDYRSSHPVLYCHACKRLFHHRNDTTMHSASIHGANGVQCANAACGRMFRTRGALVQHLESGRCESGVDMGEEKKVLLSRPSYNPPRNGMLWASASIRNLEAHRSAHRYHRSALEYLFHLFNCAYIGRIFWFFPYYFENGLLIFPVFSLPRFLIDLRYRQRVSALEVTSLVDSFSANVIDGAPILTDPVLKKLPPQTWPDCLSIT